MKLIATGYDAFKLLRMRYSNGSMDLALMNDFKRITQSKIPTLGATTLDLELHDLQTCPNPTWLLKAYLLDSRHKRVRNEPEQMWRLSLNAAQHILFIEKTTQEN